MHTLNSLVASLNLMANEQKSQMEILGWLYDYVTQYGIKMQYAEYTPIDTILKDDPRVELIDGEYVPYNITTNENKTANKYIKFTSTNVKNILNHHWQPKEFLVRETPKISSFQQGSIAQTTGIQWLDKSLSPLLCAMPLKQIKLHKHIYLPDLVE